MLKEFNKFLWDLEFIYIKELDTIKILNYIESFYKDFIEKNLQIEEPLLYKTAEVIIIAADDLLLQHSAIKDMWIKKTGENYLFHTNRGGEIFDNMIEDILTKRVVNWDVVTILVTCLLKGVRSDKTSVVLSFYQYNKNYYSLNIDNNMQKSSIQKNKKPHIKFWKILLITGISMFILTEIYYFFQLSFYVKETTNIAFQIRSIYGY